MYGDGNSYEGSVYAIPGLNGYQVGYTREVIDENGQTGTYEIMAVDASISYRDVPGEVYVDTYFDCESGNTYVPVNNSDALGVNYLDTEHGYIIQDGIAAYEFGYDDETIYEADLTAYAYDFSFTYGNRDSYTGTVYAAPEHGYSIYYTHQVSDENGLTGTYSISGETPDQDFSKIGQVYVSSYYDSESDTFQTPVNSSAALGTNYLDSEHGYIIDEGNFDNEFGRSGSIFYEADLSFVVTGTWIDLGTLGGEYSEARDINEIGQIVGYAETADYAIHAFVYENGVMTNLGGILGGDDSEAYGINNLGQIVGYALNSEGEYHAFVYDHGTVTDLGTLGGTHSLAYDINDLGKVTGYAATADGDMHAFIYDLATSTMTDLGTLGGNYSYAYDINNSGQIVGVSTTAAGYYHAFFYDHGTMTDLGTLGGSDQSVAYEINDNGEVVGASGGHSFVYAEGAMTDLGVLGGMSSDAKGINNLGQIVGSYSLPAPRTAICTRPAA